MTQKHSPLPWKAEGSDSGDNIVVDATGVIVAAFDYVYPECACSIDEDDAAFIVRACNNHYKLVEALRSYVDGAMRGLSEIEKANIDYNSTFGRAVKALAEAEAS